MKKRTTRRNKIKRVLQCILAVPCILIAGFMIFTMLSGIVLFNTSGATYTLTAASNYEATDKFNVFVRTRIMAATNFWKKKNQDLTEDLRVCCSCGNHAAQYNVFTAVRMTIGTKK